MWWSSNLDQRRASPHIYNNDSKPLCKSRAKSVKSLSRSLKCSFDSLLAQKQRNKYFKTKPELKLVGRCWSQKYSTCFEFIGQYILRRSKVKWLHDEVCEHHFWNATIQWKYYSHWAGVHCGRSPKSFRKRSLR